MGKTPRAPYFVPFLAYSRTPPQVIEFLVVKSLFCPISQSPNQFSVRTPPPLETHFFEVLREVGVGGDGAGQKINPPPYLGQKS